MDDTELWKTLHIVSARGIAEGAAEASCSCGWMAELAPIAVRDAWRQHLRAVIESIPHRATKTAADTLECSCGWRSR